MDNSTIHGNKLHEKVLKQTSKQKDPSLIHKCLCAHSLLPGETLGQGCLGTWPSSSGSSPSHPWPTLLPMPHHGYFCVSYLGHQVQRSLKLAISHRLEFSLSWRYVPVLSHSVVSNSLQPHGLSPTRLLCLWESARQEHWSGFPFPTPGNLPSQGSNPPLWRLLHWQMVTPPLHHLGSPILEVHFH